MALLRQASRISVGVALAAAAVVPGAAFAGHAAAQTGGYCVDTPDAIGVFVGNPVTQMGFPIGRITAVEGRGESVRLTFEISTGRVLPADVKAVTRSKSLLADRSLELVGNYTDGAKLEPGTCIGLDRAYTPKSISEIAGSAADFIGGLTQRDTASVSRTLAAASAAIRGTGPAAHEMYTRAAVASRNPDRFTADIGSTIMNMAPLTEASLANWSNVEAVFKGLPAGLRDSNDVALSVATFTRATATMISMTDDIHKNYGDILWPTLNGPVADIVHVLAARAPDLQKLYATVPAIAQYMKAQGGGGLIVPRLASVKLTDAQCRAAGTACTRAGTVASADLLSLLTKGATR